MNPPYMCGDCLCRVCARNECGDNYAEGIDNDCLGCNGCRGTVDMLKDCPKKAFVPDEEGALNCVIDIIRDSQTVDGWISVKDRLPKKNQIVIVSDGEHTWDVGMYKSLCGKPSEWNWKKNTVKTVLWWMPKDGALPEPPKEDKDDD